MWLKIVHEESLARPQSHGSFVRYTRGFVQGPRQAGKTTLVQDLQTRGHRADYLTLDDPVVLEAALSDTQGFVSGLPERVILDEVQRAPDLFLAIKRSVDKNRAPGRFLLTGSADALLLPKVKSDLWWRDLLMPVLPTNSSRAGPLDRTGLHWFSK